MMMHYAALLTLSLAALARAELPGSCDGFPYEYTPGSDMNSINAIASMGEMAMVSYDPNDAEKELSCIRITLTKDKFIIKSIKGADAREMTNSLTVEEQIYEEKTRYYFKFSSMTGSGIFGDGMLYPIFVGIKEVILNGCQTTDSVPPGHFKTSYFLVPLDKAMENSGCNCADWSIYKS